MNVRMNLLIIIYCQKYFLNMNGNLYVCTSVRLFVSTYVCISMILYGTLYEYRTVGFGFCQNHFRLHFNLKKIACSTILLCTNIREYIYPFGFGSGLNHTKTIPKPNQTKTIPQIRIFWFGFSLFFEAKPASKTNQKRTKNR